MKAANLLFGSNIAGLLLVLLLAGELAETWKYIIVTVAALCITCSHVTAFFIMWRYEREKIEALEAQEMSRTE